MTEPSAADKKAIEILNKLKRKASREKSRFGKIEMSATNVVSKERAYGERNVCAMFIQWLDEEIRALDKSE